MTVYELLSRQTSIENVIRRTESGIDAVRRVFDSASANAKSEQERDDVRENANNAMMALNMAKEQLTQYVDLLRDISMATELQWPPSCMK